MSKELKKVIFKGWSILMLLSALVSGLGLLVNGVECSTFFSYLLPDQIILFIAFIPVILDFIVSVAGLKENYTLCKKITFAVFFLTLALGVISFNFSGAIFNIITILFYLYLCSSLEFTY